MPIKFTQVSESNPKLDEFKAALWKAGCSRQEAIAKATILTGVKIHDVGNTENQELFYALETLVGRKLNNFHPQEPDVMPSNTQHLVVGHAGGKDNNWFFFGTNERVKEYVNKQIPKGEKAWVIACKTEEPRFFAKLAGEELTSEGRDRTRITFQKL